MCYQTIEKHPCHHATAQKPVHCRYRSNINHKIEARLFYVSKLCKDCFAGNLKPHRPKTNRDSRKDVPGTEADEKGNGEDRGEKEWKRKLRNKLERMGNEEVLRGLMMTEVLEEEEESGWKRKLRNRLVKMGNEDILRGSMMAKEPVEQSE
jgi:hypothetical protein